MNFSNGTLHVIGAPAAIDKHQSDIIRHTLRVLYRTDRYAAHKPEDLRDLSSDSDGDTPGSRDGGSIVSKALQAFGRGLEGIHDGHRRGARGMARSSARHCGSVA